LKKIDVVTVSFWPHTTNPDIASYRLRCWWLQKMLEQRGILAPTFQIGQPAPKVLVLSKRYDRKTLEVAKQLRTSHGTKLVLDICDNHFHFLNPDLVVVERANDLRRAVASVDLVVACSTYLRDVIEDEVPDHPPVRVIGDLVEPPSLPSAVVHACHPLAWLQLQKLNHELKKTSADIQRRLVWFGNHGSSHVEGGMSDIRKLLPLLGDLHRRKSLSLTVVSNSRTKFEEVSETADFPMLYSPWLRPFFSRTLMAHHICVIPITPNQFTLAKTDNRVVTALVHGLHVVADSIPSHRGHTRQVCLDRWEEGLESAMAKTPSRPGAGIIDSNAINAGVLLQWLETLGQRGEH
jgi:hypothetical protein